MTSCLMYGVNHMNVYIRSCTYLELGATLRDLALGEDVDQKVELL